MATYWHCPGLTEDKRANGQQGGRSFGRGLVSFQQRPFALWKPLVFFTAFSPADCHGSPQYRGDLCSEQSPWLFQHRGLHYSQLLWEGAGSSHRGLLLQIAVVLIKLRSTAREDALATLIDGQWCQG